MLEKLLVLLTSVCDRAGTGYLQSTAGLWHLLRASKCFTIGNECVSGPNSTNGISTQGRHPGSGVCLQPSKAQLALGGGFPTMALLRVPLTLLLFQEFHV